RQNHAQRAYRDSASGRNVYAGIGLLRLGEEREQESNAFLSHFEGWLVNSREGRLDMRRGRIIIEADQGDVFGHGKTALLCRTQYPISHLIGGGENGGRAPLH